MIRLRALFKNENIKGFILKNKRIEKITDDTRKIEPNTLYIHTNGRPGQYFEALKTAEFIIVGRKFKEKERIKRKKTAVVPDIHAFYPHICAKFYGFPAKKLKLIGITGTNGKTSVSGILSHILTAAGHRTAVIGTVSNKIGTSKKKATNTTPKPEELHRLLHEAVACETEYCIIEASSQALAENRLAGVSFEVGAFTNLTSDHLDFHHTVENYRQSKSLLFSISDKAAVNIDDETGINFYKAFEGEKISVSGRERGLLRISDVQTNISGTAFNLNFKNETACVRVPLIGDFAAENTTLAIAAAKLLGIELGNSAKYLKTVRTVPGRMEKFVLKKGAVCIIDYAHTEDALRRVLLSLRPLTKNRLIAVFGCGGNRDRTKRAKMGAASEIADIIILTSDNPRFEEPADIIKDILKGIKNTKKVFIIEDRKEAVRKAAALARDGDILLIAGKGHEAYQEIKGKKYPFDDKVLISAQK